MFAIARIIIPFMGNIIMDESDDEEAEVIEKVSNYVEDVVDRMNDRQFKVHFRLNKETFESLLVKLSQIPENNNTGIGFPRMLQEKELMITLWYLGNTESFRTMSDRFGISKSTAWNVLYRTCLKLLEVNARFGIISWPNHNKQREIANHFAAIARGFPGIVGSIDGTHIKIIAPKNYPNSYVNRKNYHSVLLQGICDHRMLFTDVYAGEAGSLHDYSVYKRSNFYQGLQNNSITFGDDNHLVGDLAYKLDLNLMVGFKNINGRLNRRQKSFNLILNKARVKIENAFALLKGRFRRLKFLETTRSDLICLLIVTSCVLHNVCIMQNDELDNLNEVNAEEDLANNEPNMDEEEQLVPNAAAVRKRDGISNILPLNNIN